MSGTVIQFPLKLGLAEDANPKSAPMSSLKRGVNVRWVRDGVIGKRYQFSQIADLPGGASAPRRFVVRDDELSVVDGEHLYSYSPTAHSWLLSDRISETALEWPMTITDDEGGVCSSDVGVNGNVLLHAWVTGDPARESEMTPDDGGYLFVQAVNRVSGTAIAKPLRIATGARFVRILITSGWGIVFYAVGADIYGLAVLLNEVLGISLSAHSPTLLQNNIRFDNTEDGTNGRLDALLLPDGNIALAFERDPGGGGGLQFEHFSFNATTGAIVAIGTGTNLSSGVADSIKSIALAADITNGTLYCAYSALAGAGDYRVLVVNVLYATWSLHGVFVTATHFRATHISLAALGGQILVAWSGISADPTDSTFTSAQAMPVFASAVFNDGTSGGDPADNIVPNTTRFSAAMALLSNVFSMNGRLYAFVRDAHYGENAFWSDGTFHDGRNFSTGPEELPSVSSYLIEIETAAFPVTISASQIPHRIVGKIDHDICSQFQYGSLPRVAPLDGNTALAIVPFQATASPVGFDLRTGLRLVRATVDPALMVDPWRSSSIMTEAYIGGGILCVWDGRTVFDHGMRTPFLVFAAAFDGSGSSGLIGDGTYIWEAFAHFRSRAGTLHRSPASRTITIPVSISEHPGQGAAHIVFAPNAIDCKESIRTGFDEVPSGQSFYELFRTEANGSVLYQLSYGPRINPIRNAPTEQRIDFIDLANDTDITPAAIDPAPPATPLNTRPQPYPATGELEDVQPPSPYSLCFWNDRLWLISGSRREVWPSKALTDNIGVAPGFNPDFAFVFDKDVYAITGFADRIFIFFERSIRYIVGDGPTVANTDNRFSTPQLLQGEIGTKNPRSVIATPVGVFFQGTGGDIYLLDGSSVVQWVGKDVKDTVAAFPIITSAVHIAEQNEVRFSCNTTDGTSGIFLVFDYQRSTWITRTVPGGGAVIDATICGGVYYFATGTAIFQEVVGAYGDAGSGDIGGFVQSSIVLSPIASSGPISWHRVKRVQIIGTSRNQHNLTIAIARDYAETTEQTKTWDGDSPVTQPGPLERAQLALAHQKAQAIEVHISDAAATHESGGEHPDGPQGFELEGVAFLVQTKPGLARIEKAKRG